MNSQTTNDGITYTNQATFFSPNVPFFLRNGEVIIDPTFKDSITIQSELVNETGTIVNQDRLSASFEPATGLKEVLVMKNRETSSTNANGAVYIKGNTLGVDKNTEVGLLSKNVNTNSVLPQLTVTNSLQNNPRVNLKAPTRLDIGVNQVYMMSAVQRGLTNQMLIGTETNVNSFAVGDIEITDTGTVKIEANTIIDATGITTGDLLVGGTTATVKAVGDIATFGCSEFGFLRGAFSVTGNITNSADIYGRNEVNIGCETIPSGAINNAINYDGTATSIVNTPGVTTHLWAQDFQEIASFASTITTNATVTDLNVTGTLSTSGLIVNDIQTQTLDVNLSSFINTLTTNSINGTPISNPFTSFVPTGVIFPIASATYANNAVAPAGYLYCDGAIYANALYPLLAASLGTTYGGVALTSFAVPDMRFGKSIIGGMMQNNGDNFDAINVSVNMVGYNQNSILVNGIEYGLTNYRNVFVRPSATTGNSYTGPGIRPGYSFRVINGDGTIYNIIESLGSPYGNNAFGPNYNLFLTDIGLTITDRGQIGNINGGIRIYPYASGPITANPNLQPDVRAGTNNSYLNYTQRAEEVGPTQYTGWRGGVGAPCGGRFAAGDPHVTVRGEYLNALANYQDFANNPIRSPVSSSIPSAYSYSMMYIIKT